MIQTAGAVKLGESNSFHLQIDVIRAKEIIAGVERRAVVAAPRIEIDGRGNRREEEQ